MNGVWVCLKKPLTCCCCGTRNSGDVNDPVKNQIQRTSPRSGSSTNLRNGRALQIPRISSARSLESSHVLNGLRFDGSVINDSSVRRCSSVDESNLMVEHGHRISLGGASSSDVITGRFCSGRRSGVASLESDICEAGTLPCQECHLKFKDVDALEAHFLSKHSVSKLVAGDFSRKVVELICNTGRSTKSDRARKNIMAILKVNNMQKTTAEFENYRETIKTRTIKLPKKHPRCLADGNEFLGFHGTTLACSLGSKGSLDLCLSDHCGVCRILRHGFSSKSSPEGINGVLMTSTSVNALEFIEMDQGRSRGSAKALVLCRVIAGRVHKPLKRSEQFSCSSEFDSVAAKLGPNSSIEELYLLSTKALLPCFVIVFKS